MTLKEIIDGLKFTVDMFLFDPSTGETFTEPRNDMDKTTIDACKGAIELLEQTRWIPITSRPMTEEEKKDFAERTGYEEKDFDDILSCPLPEDGETVLITDRLGNVEVDTFINDCDGCYFEYNCDMEDVKAWMPLPTPYQSEIPTGAERSDKE